jgi:adenosylhomocysteine nucleosidase
MTSPVLLVVALAAERRALQGAIRAAGQLRLGMRPAMSGRLGGREVLLVQAGVGRTAAHEAVVAASRAWGVRAAWSLGFAGGLVDSLRAGDLVCPAAVLDDADPSNVLLPADPPHAALCAALRQVELRIDQRPVISVGIPLRTPEAKREVHGRCGAVAVEMEAAGVAHAARELGIPWLALKAIVDGVEDFLPQALAGCVTPQGDLAWTKLLTASLRGPEFWRSLHRLGRASRQAGRSLRHGLDAALTASAALTSI